ncbi:phosphatidylinositol 3,4,5-trisphosphate 3-phosphatase and protein-tyrosine-phosphatase PTEN2A [Iris pallida]|uniref:Phosphatidylinositol 3,4,5-trisphosphate 3-phosphatase and protein-tyrosine-phosphatase PTEN2A n=1 Tax=Iris pallida TaxID=29817 RepID=A0AAX6HUV1_IRIPA|nr:phosphatidylinositol 3,4,5-trisphosphate 3-phosphatase and protein-tyrosine-phosphatase PTEN2A [Iris pallida]
MESQQVESPSSPPLAVPENQHSSSTKEEASVHETPSILTASGISSWAKSLKIPRPSGQEDTQPGNTGKSAFSRMTSGIGLRLSPKSPQQDESMEGTSTTVQPGVLGSLTKGFMNSSRSAVKAVSVKARHIVSQNKRRYQEGGFDLDMTYITENIIAMGFPAGDLSSGFLCYVEGFYRNHMEEVIKFFETHHKGKYKVYNLCSERLYDASLLEGKVASFPFDDHNCPPIQLIISFCQSAYSWLKEDIENVVVVHCKAGMARTGLMISSLLLYLKFFPTAEESMDYYNQKRCIDGKGLVLPSQIRYVKYFERILTYFNGENQPGRRCMLRGFRLHKCPFWIRPSITISNHNGVLFSTKKHPRTKELMPEDFWFSAPRKGVMVFCFTSWLNTTMMENRTILNTSDLDGFDKRKLPSPGFQVEVVLVDYDGSPPQRAPRPTTNSESNEESATVTSTRETVASDNQNGSGSADKDDVFSDSDSESSKSRRAKTAGNADGASRKDEPSDTKASKEEIASLAHSVEQLNLTKEGDSKGPNAPELRSEEKKSSLAMETPELESTSMSEFKAIAADASVFSFGDEDYESE